MRKQLALSRTVMLGMREYRALLYGEAPVQNGFIVGLAYNNLQPDLGDIDWVRVNLYEREFLAKYGDAGTQRVKTTINIRADVAAGLEPLRAALIEENIFGTARIYLPFVIKLLILGALLQAKGALPLKADGRHPGAAQPSGRAKE